MGNWPVHYSNKLYEDVVRIVGPTGGYNWCIPRHHLSVHPLISGDLASVIQRMCVMGVTFTKTILDTQTLMLRGTSWTPVNNQISQSGASWRGGAILVNNDIYIGASHYEHLVDAKFRYK